jgi:hypothetical protein
VIQESNVITHITPDYLHIPLSVVAADAAHN